PQDHPEPGGREVIGIAEPLARGAPVSALARLPGASPELWSARALDPDSLRPRFPYVLAPFWVRQLPGPGVPAEPLRSAPRPLDEFTHVSYAIQWFLFAAILIGGSLAVARTRARHASDTAVPAAPDPDRAR
ncbi:MAG TPA: SURF1 family cytochrome oxidase biogenesis protein, partial [Terriglobales bacterium]|nr:SURF1 family cytochrome oxidase biogenesis protein [Terriglobales bacterium]